MLGAGNLVSADYAKAGASFFVVSLGGILIGIIWALLTGYTTKLVVFCVKKLTDLWCAYYSLSVPCWKSYWGLMLCVSRAFFQACESSQRRTTANLSSFPIFGISFVRDGCDVWNSCVISRSFFCFIMLYLRGLKSNEFFNITDLLWEGERLTGAILRNDAYAFLVSSFSALLMLLLCYPPAQYKSRFVMLVKVHPTPSPRQPRFRRWQA